MYLNVKRILLTALIFSFVYSQGDVVLEPSSFISYTASDPNASWTGKAPISKLELNLIPDNLSSSKLTLSLKSGDFDSGNFIRDANARRLVFESQLYPEITFTSKRITLDENVLVEGENQVTIFGDLTLHGVTREISVVTIVTRQNKRLIARGGFEISLNDFSMHAPEFFGVVVDDKVIIQFEIDLKS